MLVRKLSVFLAAMCFFIIGFSYHTAAGPPPAPGDWVPHGTVLGGAFNVIAIEPTTNTIIAGNDDGVLLSTDNGATWSATGLSEIGVQDIAFSPDFLTDTTVFAATGTHGLYESNNGGYIWVQVNAGLGSLNVRSIALTSNFSTYNCTGSIFAGTDVGLYKADNYNNPPCSLSSFSTWGTEPTGLYSSSIKDITFSYDYSKLYLVSEANVPMGLGGSVFRADPYSSIPWTSLRGNLDSLGLGTADSIISIWSSPNIALPTLFIGCDSKGPFKSTDDGSTWVDRGATTCGGAVYKFKETPSADFSTTGIVYLATPNGLKRGTDFDDLGSCTGERPDGTPVYSITLTPNYDTGASGTKAGLMYIATGNGILHKMPGGIPFSPSNDTKRVTVSDIAPNPRIDSTILSNDTVIAYIPSVGLVRSDNKGQSFTKMNPMIIPDNTSPSTTIPVFTNATFSNSWSGGNALCSGDDGTIAFSTSNQGVYISNDGGLTVHPLNNVNPSDGGGTVSTETYTVMFSPNFANAPDTTGTMDRSIFVAQNGKIYSTTIGIGDNMPWNSTVWNSTGNLPSVGGISGDVRNMTLPDDFSLLDTGHKEIYATVNPVNSMGLFGGVIKSTNGGQTWNSITTFPCNSAEITSIKLSPNYRADQTLYVSTMGCGVLKSNNAGTSWSPLPFPDGDQFINSLSISPNYATDGIVLVSAAPTGTDSPPHGIWQWNSLLSNWSPRNNGLINPATGYPLLTDFVRYSKNSPSDIWVGTKHSGAFFWNGSAWEQAGGLRSTALDITSMAFDVTDATHHTVFAGTTNEGVWISTDHGETYRPMNRGFHNSMTNTCIPPILSLEIWYDAFNAHLLAGTDGSGISYYSAPIVGGSAKWLPQSPLDTQGWSQSNLGNGIIPSFTTLYPAHQGFIMAARQGVALCHLYRSGDGGLNWGCIDNGISDEVTYVFNSGENPVGFGNGPFSPTGSITWSTTSNSGIEKANNGGAFKNGLTPTWIVANGAGIGSLTDLQTRAVIQLNDGATGVYATVLTGTVSGGVYRSLDEGDYTWVASSDGLAGTSLNVKDFMQNSTNGDVLVALRDTNGGSPGNGGAYLSGDKGRHWTSLNSGFDQNYNNLSDLVSDPGPPVVYYTGGESGPFENPVEANTYPTVSSIGTSSGLSSGGTSVDIYGTGFDSACAAAFGDEDAATTTFIDSTHVQATAPAHSPGSVKVGVRNPDTRRGDCSTNFTYTDAGESDGISLTLSKSGGIKLDWIPSNTITVRRATNPQMTTGITNQYVTGTTYTDTTGVLTDSNTYYYKVW